MMIGAATLGALVLAPAPDARADGIERPRTHRAPPPRVVRSTPPPVVAAPAPERFYEPPPPPPPSNELTLSDGFFSGPLTGGVGYSYGTGGAPGGGNYIVGGGGGSRFSGVTGAQSTGFGGGFAGGGFAIGGSHGATVSIGGGGFGCR
jgi:hypothetical protein